MTVRLLRAADVLAACPMSDANDAVASDFAALSTGQATIPVRLSVPLRDGAVALAMPAALAGASCYSVKVVTVAPANAAAGRPIIIGTVLLGDALSGEPRYHASAATHAMIAAIPAIRAIWARAGMGALTGM